MNRLAAEHPEDERYQTSEGQREVLADRVDREPDYCELHGVRRCTICQPPRLDVLEDGRLIDPTRAREAERAREEEAVHRRGREEGRRV